MENKSSISNQIDWGTFLVFILAIIFGGTLSYLDWNLSPMFDTLALVALVGTLISSCFAAGLKGKAFGIFIAIAGSSIGAVTLIYLGTAPTAALLVSTGISCLSVLFSIFFGNKHERQT